MYLLKLSVNERIQRIKKYVCKKKINSGIFTYSLAFTWSDTSTSQLLKKQFNGSINDSQFCAVNLWFYKDTVLLC